MKFFAVHLSDLDSELFTAASNDQIATWLYLHKVCAMQTNGGTITGAATIGSKFWNRHGMEKEIIDKPSPLWTWTGDDLTLHPYDHDGEALFLKKSQGGKDGAARRWKGAENRSPIKESHMHITRDKRTRDKRTKPDPTQQAAEAFSIWFRSLIDLEPKNWQTVFPAAYDKLTRIDKLTDHEIREVCTWARNDSFWRKNFFSPAKLRERNKEGIKYFDLFREKMKGNTRPPDTSKRPATYEEV